MSIVAIVVAGWSAWSQHRFNREQAGAADLYFWMTAYHHGNAANPFMSLHVENRGSYNADDLRITSFKPGALATEKLDELVIPKKPRVKVGEPTLIVEWQAKEDFFGPFAIGWKYRDKLGEHSSFRDDLRVTSDNLD